MEGKLRHMFPGGNTPNGFHSFYDYLIPADANKIFVIKGGPGVGKSSFMKRIGEEMLSRGFNVEYHHCSSDGNSLDGVALPDQGIALLDGTAPHVVDPKHPGAIDEIIHLGDYWDEMAMRANRESVLTITKEIGRLFRKAYGYLRGAKNYQDEYASYLSDIGAVDRAALNAMALGLERQAVPGSAKATAPRERHLFATAITPDGPVSYVENLVSGSQQVIVLQGGPGTGTEFVVSHLRSALASRGYYVEVYHCPLDPQHIEHLVVPELSLAIVTSREPHVYSGKATWVEDLNILVDNKRLALYRKDMERALNDSKYAFDIAIGFIMRAKSLHDDLETFYVPNMDFTAISARRDKTLRRIIELAR